MKSKLNHTYILCGCVLMLALLCILSIGSPIRFDNQRSKREKAVKVRLMSIRSAEEKYRTLHGVYATTFRDLVESGLLSDSAAYIPYSGGMCFTLTATTLPGKGGGKIPVMECGATYSQYLQGLDKTSIADITEEANVNGRFPGLKIGDINAPNDNAGNW